MMAKNKVYIFLIMLLVLPIVSAETTFFEGELGYRDDFIMVDEEVPEIVGPYCGDNSCNGAETCSSCSEDCGSCSTGGGGGIISALESSDAEKVQVCGICLQDLREHIKEKQNIDYSLEELEVLTTKINAEVQVGFTSEQTKVIIENFEEECNSYIPVLGGLIPGRYRSLAIPVLIAVLILIVGFAVYLFYVLTKVRRVKNKVKHKGKLNKKKGKKKR